MRALLHAGTDFTARALGERITEAMIRHFVSNGLEPATSTPAEFQALIAADLQVWRKLIKDAGISVGALSL